MDENMAINYILFAYDATMEEISQHKTEQVITDLREQEKDLREEE